MGSALQATCCLTIGLHGPSTYGPPPLPLLRWSPATEIGIALLSGSNHAVQPEAIHLRVLVTHRYSCVPDRGVRADVHRTAEHRRTPHVGRDKTLQRSIIYCNSVQRSKSCARKA
jgi:hypothetical protein